MIVKTKAIVLSSIKYSDADLIVKCYTEHGVKSYLLKRILKAKKGRLKAAYFQPLTQLELTASHNDKGNLNYIKEAKIYYPYNTISSNIIKQAIVIFLSEVLSNILREEESNAQLFEYLETSLIWLDVHDRVSNFHLLFLLNLTRFLGCYPDKEKIESEYFNLEEGLFSKTKPLKQHLLGKKLALFKKLLGINFDGLNKLKLNSVERQELLEVLVHYFELHLLGFYNPKSLTVLKTIFV